MVNSKFAYKKVSNKVVNFRDTKSIVIVKYQNTQTSAILTDWERKNSKFYIYILKETLSYLEVLFTEKAKSYFEMWNALSTVKSFLTCFESNK
jgi:hypothetical protein